MLYFDYGVYIPIGFYVNTWKIIIHLFIRKAITTVFFITLCF